MNLGASGLRLWEAVRVDPNIISYGMAVQIIKGDQPGKVESLMSCNGLAIALRVAEQMWNNLACTDKGFCNFVNGSRIGDSFGISHTHTRIRSIYYFLDS